MVRPDRHTPCPGCHQSVRALYYAALQLVEQLDAVEDRAVDMRRELGPKIEATREAVKAFMPIVSAHNSNQDHALSPELVEAREGLWR